MKFKSIFLFRKMKENLIGRNENIFIVLLYANVILNIYSYYFPIAFLSTRISIEYYNRLFDVFTFLVLV